MKNFSLKFYSILFFLFFLAGCNNTGELSLDNKNEPFLGGENASVVITEFSDFECPACSQMPPILHSIANEFGNKIKIVYRNFPLPMHSHSREAAEAARCAYDQNKFWEMHDEIFANQNSLSKDKLKELAVKIGLDTTAFQKCFDGRQHAAKIEADFKEAVKLGITSTPTFFVNGQKFSGVTTYEVFKNIIEGELAKNPQ